MIFKKLREQRNWSQEQLADMCGLNVRTIQRVEKGERVGRETLKSLAAVLEISTNELMSAIENEKQSSHNEEEAFNRTQLAQNKAKEKVKSVKYFYGFSALLIANFIFLMLPNYNGGENLGALVVVFLSYCVIIAGLACYVFEPFGKDWEQKKISQILNKQSDKK